MLSGRTVQSCIILVTIEVLFLILVASYSSCRVYFFLRLKSSERSGAQGLNFEGLKMEISRRLQVSSIFFIMIVCILNSGFICSLDVI